MGKPFRCKLGIHTDEWAKGRVGWVCKFCGRYKDIGGRVKSSEKSSGGSDSFFGDTGDGGDGGGE